LKIELKKIDIKMGQACGSAHDSATPSGGNKVK